jgi:hypothetical protein
VRVFRLAFPLLLSCILAGCAEHSLGCSIGLSQNNCDPGTAGYQQQQEDAAKAAAADKAAAAEDDAKCQSQGLQPNTPHYEQCRTKLADQRAAADDNDRAAIAARLQGRSPMSN